MRTVVLPLFLVAALCAPAHAEDKPTPAKPTEVGTLEQLLALEAKVKRVKLRWFKGSVAALSARAPGLVALTLHSNGSIPLEEVKALRHFPQLRQLGLVGDMGFPTSHFKAVGNLSRLEGLTLSLE